jgi:hypothetical protein
MKLLLAIVIIIAVSILGARLTFLDRRLSMGFRSILLTGTEYIFIGVLLGGMGFDILDDKALDQMEPFLVFGLCWIGFLFGLQFKVQQIKKLPGFYFTISAGQALITFLFISVSMYFAFRYYLDLPEPVLLMAAVTLGSAASCTAQSSLGIVSKNYKVENRRLLELMRCISGIDGFYALGFFALALGILPGGETAPFDLYASLKWFFTSIAMGVIPALILISLSRVRFSPQEFFVFLIGTVMFCGGLSYQIRYSPLIAGLVCGVVTANFCRHHLRALSEVLQAEKPIYIILLLLLGASWELKPDFSLVITGVYFLIRALGKVIGTFAASRVFKPDYPVPAGLGLGLISEGGLAVAIIINFKLLYPAIGDPLVTVIILAVFANELLSPWLILFQFEKKERVSGQTRPIPQYKKEKTPDPDNPDNADNERRS